MPNVSKDSIIILDIDGTVIDSPAQTLVSAKVADAIKLAEKTRHISLATGRTWQWTKPVIDSLDLREPTIVSGGTEIRDFDGKILWEVFIPDDSIPAVVGVFQEYSDRFFLVDNYAVDDYLSGGNIFFEELKNMNKIKEFQLPYLTRVQADKLEKKVNSVKGVIAVKTTSLREGMTDLHVMSSFATKEHAITELLKITQIDVDKTTGIGDGHNDLHIFAAVRNKIAMGNAVDEMKDAADRVIGCVEDDGLADYLNELSSEVA